MKRFLPSFAIFAVAASSIYLVGFGASANASIRGANPSSTLPNTSSTPSTIPTGSSTTSTTTTTAPPELAQKGWIVVAKSQRGVMVDRKTVVVSGIAYTAVRFRSRTVAFHLHGGTIDPPGSSTNVPADAKPQLSDGELRVGVLAAFNGGFKANANAGGVIMDGRVLEAMVPGMATACINNLGQLKIAAWGAGLPTKKFAAISCRQNLPLLVAGAKLTALAANPAWGNWGATLASIGAQPRSGLGLDAKGNVIYVATMSGTLPSQLAQAEIEAGIVTGMQLDINPDWPSIGAFSSPMHQRRPSYSFELPGFHHDPAQYFTSSERDFFSVMAEPNSWNCSVGTPGLTHGKVTPQPISVSGTGC